LYVINSTFLTQHHPNNPIAMKNFSYLILFCPLISFAQHTTTETEYNYLTKGYKEDVANGRDLKSGYRLDPIEEDILVGTYTFTFRAFIKLDEKALAAVQVVVKSKQLLGTSYNLYYLCIPINNRELNERYLQSISSWDGPISRTYAYVSSVLFANLATEEVNRDLRK
jgi:hypothetical protein